jgi:hypothetical protein
MKRIGMLILAIGVAFFAHVVRADWTPAKRLTWNSGTSQYPVIAVDSSDKLHVVWVDDTPGNLEIYYMKGK